MFWSGQGFFQKFPYIRVEFPILVIKRVFLRRERFKIADYIVFIVFLALRKSLTIRE